MSDDGSGEGIHIDSDWKEEAAREKDRLSEQEKADAAAGEGAGAAAADTGPVTFYELVNILAMQAAIALGGYQGPGGERIPANPPAAKHHIDLLSVLGEKTKGNLTDEEDEYVRAALHDLRMRFVAAAQGGSAGTGEAAG